MSCLIFLYWLLTIFLDEYSFDIVSKYQPCQRQHHMSSLVLYIEMCLAPPGCRTPKIHISSWKSWIGYVLSDRIDNILLFFTQPNPMPQCHTSHFGKLSLESECVGFSSKYITVWVIGTWESVFIWEIIMNKHPSCRIPVRVHHD